DRFDPLKKILVCHIVQIVFEDPKAIFPNFPVHYELLKIVNVQIINDDFSLELVRPNSDIFSEKKKNSGEFF
ncbi:MAG: hypothetical protein J6X20_02970, partial [Bacteroidales bacterium]|nr:hypothetical protein [Bacteroidales bacterium]